ncbi:MAG: hypothetical protein HDQ91_00165 [Desulfovibrio sp.]|nr:hypothetical protein [Desulfovibrio sp.]
MAVSGINNYRDAMYQWQSQQLKTTGASSSSTASSTALNALFGGSASMTSQISSMVELTKYAMDQMGLSSDARVTFSQIGKYREQLQSEFNAGVKKGLEESGISNLAALSFELDKNGAITAVGENAKDRKTAQAWLDANPSYGKTLLENLPEDAFASSSSIAFNISTTGKITVKDSIQDKVQAVLNQKGDLADNARSRMKTAGIDINYPVEFTFDADGAIKVAGDSEQASQINAWLKENPELGSELQAIFSKQKIDPSSVTVRLGSQGALQATVSNAELRDIQAGFDKAGDTGQKLISGLGNLGIDKNINFSIQIGTDGSFKVISDHPDAAKLQQFFDDNPELVKKFRQIETLAGIDDARKAMQISPSSMRKRIQIESMSAWWAGSGNANSYFGQYSGVSGLSLLSGLNLQI